MKTLAKKALTSPMGLRAVRMFREPRIAVFMLHRFDHPGHDGRDADPGRLRSILSGLRTRGVEVASLQDVVSRLETGPSPTAPTVVFTIDDGYHEVADVGLPVFAEFDYPVTVFLTTRFVDGSIWCWWDVVEFTILQSRRSSVQLQLAGQSVDVGLGSREERAREVGVLTERLKGISDADRRAVISSLPEAFDVPIETSPPSQYRAMTWDQVRALESDLVSFGPHTETHPILAQTDDEVSEREITGAWATLQSQCANPVPVFCYPNGTADSFGTREEQVVAAAGMKGAVAVREGYISTGGGGARYSLPRFPYPDDELYSYSIAGGLARES